MSARATSDLTEGLERSDAQHLLDAWAAAIVANDPDRIAAFTEPDWILVTPESGPIPLDRFLAVVGDGSLTHSEMAFDVRDVRSHGDVAIVVAHGTNAGAFNDEPFTADELVTEVFIRRGDGWRCSVSALTPCAPAVAPD